MPIYEYRCDACGHDLEALQKVADPHLTDCPACGQPTLKRRISAPSFRLKGGGWYETDFKKDGDRKRNLAEGGDAAAKGDGGKEAGKGEAGKTDVAKTDVAKTDTAKSDTSKASPGKGGGSEAAA